MNQDVSDASTYDPDDRVPQRRAKRFRARQWLFRLITVCMSLLIGLLFAEMLLRICGFSGFKGIAYSMPDPELSHVNKPLANVEVRGVDFRYKVRINSLGFRGDELRSSADTRVLLIGDSYTFGQGVDDDETIAVRLQQLLNQSENVGIEVINAGVYAYGALQAKGMAMRHWDTIRPDVVVFTHCGNDFADDLRYKDGRYKRLRAAIPGRRFLRENSALYSVVKPKILSILSSVGIYNMQLRFEEAGEGNLVSDLGAEWQKGRDATCGALLELSHICEEREARFFVTSVGFSSTEDGLRLSSDAQTVNEFCAANGIEFLDPRISFPTGMTEPWHNETSVGHFSPLGNRLFADSLYSELTKRGVFARESGNETNTVEN